MDDKKSPYFADEENISERVRLNEQGRELNKVIMPLLSLDIPSNAHILDVACGTGIWAIERAKAYPDTHIVGADFDRGLVAFAKAQAVAEHVSNVEFQLMNVLTEPLKFDDNTFDVVTIRMAMGFMHRDSWPVLLQECKRVLKPGGYLAVTELESTVTNDYAYEQLIQPAYTAFHRAGYTFASDPDCSHMCIGLMLKSLLRQAGFADVEHKSFALDFSTGESAHEPIIENYISAFDSAGPFFVKTGATTLEQIPVIQEYLKGLLHKPGFIGYWHFLSAYGQKP